MTVEGYELTGNILTGETFESDVKVNVVWYQAGKYLRETFHQDLLDKL